MREDKVPHETRIPANAEPGDMRIAQSTAAYRRLYTQVVDAAENGDLTIRIEDNDR